MATPFLGLNQYAGGDVVSYLDGGYNSDMSKIDTGVQNASQKADAVESEVGAIKAASNKNSADIITLTNGLSSTNQNVTDLTNTVNLVKNDVFVQYTATLNSTTITISGSGGNSFYFIMPENFNTTFAYVVNGVICTLVNMGGTSFKNGQIAKGAPVFVRLIGTVMYAVGALESEGGVTPVDYAHTTAGNLAFTSTVTPNESNLFYVNYPNLKQLIIYGYINYSPVSIPVDSVKLDLSSVEEMPNITSTSQVFALCYQLYNSSGANSIAMPRFRRNGLEIIGPGSVTANTINFYFQCCLSYSKW
jgi:hypothetical protein